MKEIGRIVQEISFNGMVWLKLFDTNLRYIEPFNPEIETVSFDNFWERCNGRLLYPVFAGQTMIKKRKYLDFRDARYFKNDCKNGELYIRRSFDDKEKCSITEIANQLNADDFCDWLQDKQINDLYVCKN